MRLQDKVAVITGAGGGMGRIASQMFAAEGAKIVVAEYGEAAGAETAKLVQEAGGQATFIKVDVSTEAGAKAMIAHAIATYGRVDVLYNNAGIMPEADHSVVDTDVATWDSVMAVNVRGVFLGCKHAIPVMIEQGSGSIINIASIIGLVGHYPGRPAVGGNYAAAKSGVVGFTRQIAAEYARDNIRANAIAPGWHGGTRLGDERRTTASAEEIAAFEAAIRAQTPMGRRGTPEELQGLAIYLASDASRYVTGQVFAHDGGWTAV